MTRERCYHCGDALPAGRVPKVEIGGQQRSMCCQGCAAVAGLIAGQGLGEFYRFRSDFAPRPPDDNAEDRSADRWNAYDREAMQRSHVQTLADGHREVVLLVEGITCAACSWLIEHIIGAERGVEQIQVNPATGRALLRWNADEAALSALLRRLANLGYEPHPIAPGDSGPSLAGERGAALKRLIVAGLGMMQVMTYAVALYAGAIHADMDTTMQAFLRHVSLLVATPVYFYAGMPFLRAAWRDLCVRRVGMDVPVALAISAAYWASVWNIFIGGGAIYFDSVTMFIFFLAGARYLEMAARHRAARSTGAIARMLPATALRINADGDSERVALAELETGNRVRVPLGEAVPSDGEIVSGTSRFDESLLTGEFMPVTKSRGQQAVGGSINLDAPVDIALTQVGQDTRIAGIVRLLDRAQSQRPALAILADRIASHFVAAVLVAAALVGAWWTWHSGAGIAFEVVLAMLVVTCPCALSLATPTALVAATARLARRGLLVSRTGSLEPLARADTLLLDKTGTLTQARLTVDATTVHAELDAPTCRGLAAALQAHSHHPIAEAFHAFAQPGLSATAVSEHAGHGIAGTVDGRSLRLGRPDWVLGDHAPRARAAGGATRIALADAQGPLAEFSLTDTLRPDAHQALAQLREQGMAISIVSGDAPEAVAELAAELDVAQWQARMTPEDKLAHIRSLQAEGHTVIMLGDGINDAPVLAGADISIAMGSGSTVAQAQADMVLTSTRLTELADGIYMARAAIGVIRQNLLWALAYNVTALPLAAAGLLAPWMAALGMSASSLVVVANAARLNRFRAAHVRNDTGDGAIERIKLAVPRA